MVQPLILVTGANGHIGNHVVKNLLAHGFQVRILCRPGSDRAGLRFVENSVEIFLGNVLDRASLAPALVGCDGVIHCAAVFSANLFLKAKIKETAVTGTLNVLTEARFAEVRRIVLVSSTATIGPCRLPGVPCDETQTAENSRSDYALAKIEAEKTALAYARANDLELVVVCPSTVIGPNDFRLTPSNAIIKNMLRQRMFFIPGGFNLVAVEDVADGIRLAYEKGQPFERYILSGTNLSFRELLEQMDEHKGRVPFRVGMPVWLINAVAKVFDLIATVTRKQMPVTSDGVRAHAGVDWFFNNDKARRELEFAPGPIGETVKATVDWIEQHFV